MEEKNKFSLKRAKMLKNGGVSVNYEQTNAQNVQEDISVSVSDAPHPDLYDSFQKLEPRFTEICKILPEAIVEITGFALSGSDENPGVVITGKIMTESDIPIGLATHRISLSHDIYGFENELKKELEKATAEIKAYLFNYKRAQTSLFDEDDE